MAADHLMAKQVQRDDKIQEDRREAARIKQQREKHDREIGEKAKRKENMKNTKINQNLNKKKASFLTTGTTSLKVPGYRDQNTDIPSKPSPIYKPLLGYPMKPPSLLSSFRFLGTPRELPPIPKAPVFLETSPASLSDPRTAPEKSRKVEASILRLR